MTRDPSAAIVQFRGPTPVQLIVSLATNILDGCDGHFHSIGGLARWCVYHDLRRDTNFLKTNDEHTTVRFPLRIQGVKTYCFLVLRILYLVAVLRRCDVPFLTLLQSQPRSSESRAPYRTRILFKSYLVRHGDRV